MTAEPALTINWSGPYAWPGFEKTNGLPPIPKDRKGVVYMNAYEYGGSYLIRDVGMTGRSAHKRWTEHRQACLDGAFPIYDSELAKAGIRAALWEGGTYRKKDQAPKLEFANRKVELQTACRLDMAATRIFITDRGLTDRLGERLEVAIIKRLLADNAPLVGRGRRALRPRREDEAPITVLNTGAANLLYDLPSELMI
jgi:hypothetical protein